MSVTFINFVMTCTATNNICRLHRKYITEQLEQIMSIDWTNDIVATSISFSFIPVIFRSYSQKNLPDLMALG